MKENPLNILFLWQSIRVFIKISLFYRVFYNLFRVSMLVLKITTNVYDMQNFTVNLNYTFTTLQCLIRLLYNFIILIFHKIVSVKLTNKQNDYFFYFF